MKIREPRSFAKSALLCFLFLVVFTGLQVSGQTGGRFLNGFVPVGGEISGIPDSSPARRKVIDLIQAPITDLRVGNSTILTDPFMPMRVRFRIDADRRREFAYLIFENETRGTDGRMSFPETAGGNIIIRRRYSDGAIDQVKFFLGQGPWVYLRYFPIDDTRTRASFYAYNDVTPLIQDFVLPFSLTRLLTMPTQEVLHILSGNQQWKKFLNPAALYEYADIEYMVEKLRPLLPLLPDAEDGAMDENGHLVRIETLLPNGLPGFNCSGFAKWVADGIYNQLEKRLLKIDELKEKHFTERGSALGIEFEELRDPYFGLDWIRNIGAKINSAYKGVQYGYEDSDVRDLPFFEYTEDAGYRVEDLWQVMYLLAIQEPGRFYLGSVNGEFGENPRLWQHFHIVVFFPWFDESGTFHVSVMERNVETGIDSLQRRYPRYFMHLVSLPTLGGEVFDPPRFVSAGPN